VEVSRGQAIAYQYHQNGEIAHTPAAFTAIPYYAWANRGAGQMEVWLPTTETGTHPTPFPSIASQSQVTVSGQTEAANGNRNPRVMADQEQPTSSTDNSSQYNWWPRKGTSEWAQYNFGVARQISSVDVYWFVEKNGEVALPASWRVLYLSGSEWKPVEAENDYGLAVDKFNHTTFKPVTTLALKLELTLQKEKSAGISEWRMQ
jgi:hypothetical protein